MRLFENANYDFLRYRRLSSGLTAAFVTLGLLTLVVRGVPESIEFTGGTLLQVRAMAPAVDIGSIRSALADGGIPGAQINTFGSPRDFVIRVFVADSAGAASTQAAADAVTGALTQAFGADAVELARAEVVSPQVGRELRIKALLAVLLSFAATLVYITFRFEWRFGVAAILATAHDIAATVAFIALAHIEVELVIVAAVLTIVGYSLNDTIVVFDRVRENLHKYKRAQIAAVLNRSINETLSRTVLTGGATVLAVLALIVLGGPVIRGFSLTMLFGMVIGTFSSIFIAAPMLLLIERRWPGEDVRGARALVTDQPQPDAR